ncbi:MAG: AraC family transcriptional regulator [Spirochaetaceae bacterium]|jgi:AraC-like DNA-binding protein|nr:AraC family transcriptional regulator [Spirochaetaceae bacterium]
MKLLDVVFVYHLVGHERVAWHGRYHAHNCGEYEIHFFVDGDGTFLCGKSCGLITGGRLLTALPLEFHSIIPDSKKRPISYYALLFRLDENETDNLIASMLSKNREIVNINNRLLRIQCEEISEMFNSGDPNLKIAAEHLLISVLFRFFPIETNFPLPGKKELPENGKIRRTNHVQITKALAIMQVNVCEALGIDEMARIVGISMGHFIRMFRREVKMSPYQYILRLKIEGATGLLISTPQTIEEISEWFGFKNQFHFSRVFKKCTGLSPSQYRKIYVQTVDFASPPPAGEPKTDIAARKKTLTSI